ncbi:MAG: hypothetical protein KDH96_04020 [Candidatus Riesia sp.]|nr:hypothetical protein [Candidatus Riesia sp.]
MLEDIHRKVWSALFRPASSYAYGAVRVCVILLFLIIFVIPPLVGGLGPYLSSSIVSWINYWGFSVDTRVVNFGLWMWMLLTFMAALVAKATVDRDYSR